VKVLRDILSELWGLFFDDGLLALGLLIWIAVVAVAVPRLDLAWIGGPVLFLGAALVLAISVVRAARRRNPVPRPC
jgi:membrane protein implicated in regulation of membrane protease activity